MIKRSQVVSFCIVLLCVNFGLSDRSSVDTYRRMFPLTTLIEFDTLSNFGGATETIDEVIIFLFVETYFLVSIVLLGI